MYRIRADTGKPVSELAELALEIFTDLVYRGEIQKKHTEAIKEIRDEIEKAKQALYELDAGVV